MNNAVLYILLFLIPAALLPKGSHAQTGKDTINYSSTCVNTTILFASPVFDSLPFPSYIKWHFGDPSSGYNDSSTAQQARHNYTTPGTYAVSLKVANYSTDTISMTLTITIVTPMNYNFGPDIYLCGKNPDTVLTGPVIAGAGYTWNDPDTTHTPTLHVTKSGVYTVAVNGCGVADSIGVFASDTPAIKLGKDHIMCDSANLVLNAASQNGTYTWILNGSTLPFTGDQLLTHYPGGTYIAVVTVPGCGVYSDTVSITYSAPPAPPFDLGPDTLLCPKQPFTLNATIPGATAYTWGNGTATATLSTAPTISITSPGLYWVFVTYNGQCQVTDSINVAYRGDKPLDFHDTAICQGSTLSLDADFGTGTYNWTSIPAQRDDQNQTGQSTYFVYRPGKYAVTATVGQCIYTDTLTVRFDDSLHVSMIKDTTLCNGEDFWLQVKGNADTYAWQDSTYSATYHPAQSGIYTVVAQNGCGKDTLTATIAFAACDCQLLLPNAFTPDGDGHNDTFHPLHACEMDNFQMNIYDRYGELVFRSVNTETGWDGTFHGTKVPAGAFVWMAHYINTATKQPVFRKGTVLVIR
ncbi:MAG TPA: gliding motility-associated C-terminal domain-containing protein [Puia sp.]|jgi:gliding motility-associated-like protein